MTEIKERKYKHDQLRIPDEADLPFYCAVWNGLYAAYSPRTATYARPLADEHTGLIMARGWSIERVRRNERDAEIATLKRELAQERTRTVKLAATVVRNVCGLGDEPLNAYKVRRLAEGLRKAAIKVTSPEERKRPIGLGAIFMLVEAQLIDSDDVSGQRWCEVCGDSLLSGSCKESCARVKVRRSLGLENTP